MRDCSVTLTNTEVPAVVIVHIPGYSNGIFSTLEIMERGIMTACGTRDEEKERKSCRSKLSLTFMTDFI